MCRSIVTLRGLEPPATSEELEAAARQYVRKVTGVRTPSPAVEAVFETAVRAVAEATAAVLAEMPPRRQPPATVPPTRRLYRTPGAKVTTMPGPARLTGRAR